MPRYYDDDGYYYDEPIRPQRPRMSSQQGGHVMHLQDPYFVNPMYRTRSQGHSRAPDVHIYNDVSAQARADPLIAPPSPRGRAALAVYDAGYVEYPRARSRNSSYARSTSRERIIAEYKREQEEFERDKERAVREAEQKRKDEAEHEKEAKAQAVRKWKEDEEKKKQEEKDAQEAAVRKWKEDEEKKKKDEKAAQEAAVQKWKEEEEAKKLKKAKEDEEYRERVRKDFERMGLKKNQIEYMMRSEEDQRRIADGTLIVRSGRPVFPKIKRADIALDTLKHFDLAWENDPKDKDYIIILREMSERETDVLFEHTKRLRERTTILSIEASGKDKAGYQWVRRKSQRGKSPRREKVVEKLFLG